MWATQPLWKHSGYFLFFSVPNSVMLPPTYSAASIDQHHHACCLSAVPCKSCSVQQTRLIKVTDLCTGAKWHQKPAICVIRASRLLLLQHQWAGAFCRWLVGVSYRVSFGSDPIANAGGGVFGGFASVPGAIHLDEDGDMEVSLRPECTYMP